MKPVFEEKNAPCKAACPIGNPIAKFMTLVTLGREEKEIADVIREMFAVRGREMADNTLRQAMVPAGAAVIEQTINPAQEARPKNQIEGYRLLARLGSGAMGSVYAGLLAFDGNAIPGGPLAIACSIVV